MCIVNGTNVAQLDTSTQSNGDMRTPIYYDRNDTGYYIDPNSSSTAIRVGGYAYFGLAIDGDGTVINHDQIWTPSGQFHIQYSGGGNLNLCNGGGYVYVPSTSMRAPIFYDQNDTSYYTNPNSDSSMYQIKVWGNQIVIRGGSPTLFFQDTDENCAMLHNNSNLFYILRGGNDTTSWSTVANGMWPVYWNLTNNDATFGGAITAAGNITAYSDARLKDNVETITSALDKTLALRGVYYTLIYDETKTRKLGVIAQEVQEVVPEVVMLHQDKEDPEGTLAVDYGNMVGLLIEAIKELEARVKELEAR
jgi:hypothetical protein